MSERNGGKPGSGKPEAGKPEAGKPFDAAAEARRLARGARFASLATLDRRTGAPYASLVSTATDIDGAPIILISRLAVHTRNIEVDPMVSILFSEIGAGDPLLHPRVSVSATAQKVESEGPKRRFLTRNPAAEMYAGFQDFAFYRLQPLHAHLVAGFGRIVDLAVSDLLLDVSKAPGLVEAEAEAVAHVNEDHKETLSLYATQLLGRAAGPWRMTGLDPEGFDLASGDETARVIFPNTVNTPGDLRKAFQVLAEQARATRAGSTV